MREAIKSLAYRGDKLATVGSHFGLAYDAYAPRPEAPGKPDVEQRRDWLDLCERITPDKDYANFLRLWTDSFGAESLVFTVECESRLLIGHGNPSGADVGLTVHHTWGVPIIPGSSLKGLLTHFIDANYGSDDNDNERRTWRGPTWENRRIAKGRNAGDDYAILFGRPPTSDDDTETGRAGNIVFHDALYLPGPSQTETPFALDVLTVHQPSYYNSKGESWPNDWDSPNPVGFITVKPKTRFVVALTCPDQRDSQVARQWLEFARDQLKLALDQWGIGGKTSAGYGRMKRV